MASNIRAETISIKSLGRMIQSPLVVEREAEAQLDTAFVCKVSRVRGDTGVCADAPDLESNAAGVLEIPLAIERASRAHRDRSAPAGVLKKTRRWRPAISLTG